MEVADLNASSALAVALTMKPLFVHDEFPWSGDLEPSIKRT